MKQTSKIVKQKPEPKKDRRAGQGRVIALSRHVYRLQGKDTFYVESESCDGRYYFVRFMSSFAGGFCSCKDYESNRSEMCKHQHAVFYAIKYNTIQEVDKLPEEVKAKKQTAKSYLDDQSIRTLNDLEKAEIEAEEYSRTQRQLTYQDDEYDF